MKPWIRKAQIVIFYLTSLALIGVTSALSGGVGFNFWKDTTWWINQALSYGAVTSVIIGTLMAVVSSKMEKDEEYQEIGNFISTFSRNRFRPSIWSRFALEFNRQRKRNKFSTRMKNKLSKIEDKAKQKDFNAWDSGDRKDNKYCRQRHYYETKIARALDCNNIDNFKIKYDKVTSDLILGGDFHSQKLDDEDSFVTKSKGWKVVKDKLPSMLISFGLMTFASSVFVDLSYNDTFVLNSLVKLVSLFWNIGQMIPYGEAYFITVVLKDMRFRKGVIQEYDTWVKKKVESKEVIDNA